VPFYSPLRYPGGKRRLSDYVKLLLQCNDLDGAEYVEPYGGGCAIALALLFEGYVSHIHINDLSRSVYAFWHAVLNETESLCTRIRETPVTVEEWHAQRALQKRPSDASLLDLGFSTFFMNRTNRSGIIRGGMIGGKDQSGPYKLDARYNVQDLIHRIKRVASYRRRISIYGQDASVFITGLLPTLPENALVYLDPPYYVRGKRLYENEYEYSDHKEIADLVGGVQQRWVVTYEKAPEIVELYEGYRYIEYSLHYSAGERYSGSEVMFFSDDLAIPRVVNPASLTRAELRATQAALPPV
jgi:DNA adenine methylase